MELAPNQNVDLVSGDHATVIEELGRGGQGIVYRVDINGKQMALKWYSKPPADADDFYKNLQRNIHYKAPSEAFIWPLDLTVKNNDCFGYVMRLRPDGYSEFGSYLLNKSRFKSFDAMFTAAMKICDGFKYLHRQGYSYQDLNDGNFFINPETGDVLICDNDNVVADGQKSGIRGKARYMAPEVVLGGLPNKYSDRFSLSVVLFMLFFANHPFEGSRVSGCPCMTEDYEKKFYGSEAVFIFDPVNRYNRPVPGKHVNVLRRWPVFPGVLKDVFVQEFSQEKLKDPTKRITESEWEPIIARARDTLFVCPHCGEETFFELDKDIKKCMDCGENIDIPQVLSISGTRDIPLTAGSKIFIDMDTVPEAAVVNDDKGRIWLRNISSEQWRVVTHSGKTKLVNNNEVMPAKEGLDITFRVRGSDYKAVIRNNQ